jgi:hypothetical protein
MPTSRPSYRPLTAADRPATGDGDGACVRHRLATTAVIALATGAPSNALAARPRTDHCGDSLPAVSGRSFSWADAGVGAAAGGGTVFALVGAALLASRGPQRVPEYDP